MDKPTFNEYYSAAEIGDLVELNFQYPVYYQYNTSARITRDYLASSSSKLPLPLQGEYAAIISAKYSSLAGTVPTLTLGFLIGQQIIYFSYRCDERNLCFKMIALKDL